MTPFNAQERSAAWPETGSQRDWLFAAFALVALFLAAVYLRPVLPLDETRYLSVAWEMHLRGNWLAPLTLNFELYEHKPPMLFWLINTSWALFGVSRWAAVLTVVLSMAAVVALTLRLSHVLLPELGHRVVYVLLGGLPFVLYGTLIMFDITLAAFVLGVLLCFIDYARNGRARSLLFAGLLLGAGVLTKGPVAYLYVLFPALSWPLWRDAGDVRRHWYPAMLAVLAVSVLPVLVWLGPTLMHTDSRFAHELLWDQTALRIFGSGKFTHARPIWFYLPFLLLFGIPWLFMPQFWRQMPALLRLGRYHPGLRFLAAWLLPTVLVFSLVSGKQPHYLLPLLPGFAIAAAWLLRQTSMLQLRRVASAVVVVAVALNVAASVSVFKRYDLEPVARYVGAHPQSTWVYASRYQGQLGFLGRIDFPIETLPDNDIRDWLDSHPGGLAIVAYRNESDRPDDATELMSVPYRGRRMGVFAEGKDGVSLARSGPAPGESHD